MAIFEKPSQTKSVVDDTEKLICTVENAQNINKHTEYILRVQRGPSKENTWHVSRRYRDFAALHSSLQQANIDLPLPPKKLIGNMQPSFIAERQIALQNYIDEVLKREVLALTLQVRSFLDPSNYSLAIAEQALQSVSIALRGDGRYELKGPLNGIGWRPRKHYFLVTDIENRSNCILSWQTYGPDRALSDKDLQTAFKSLQSISHPYIDDILAIHNLETGAYVVRKIHETGSLRDILYGTDYSKNYLAKYGNPKVRKPFTIGQIAHYGYQILQALKFLHEKGLPHGHLHPGNIAIDNQKAMLMDVENGLIGASCFYRSHLRQRRRACSAEAVDVHCFALTLYEMAFGEPLTEPYKDTYPAGTDEGLESVLRLCLSRSASKYGALSVEELLCQPLFARAPLNGFLAPDHDRAHLKFPLALKDEIRKAVELVEARLKTEQKLDRSTKREVRIQEILNSEEEMKKQKRRAKKRDSVWKSTSSLAETVRSHSASTASSPTPPALSAEPQNNGHSSAATSPSASNGRSALLDAICGFDKSRLARAPR
ncbi:PX domain-containing protein kinase-like protein [Ostrinia furnacalis]|uniref:PX domain-containing protein kinase-like protein n=1 Tax=Ostrinia furnacalis TaxID=93504 RepID=UPI00103B14B1|nr:PX domain-containing protein kinase-like protein [Ostrinia furnacalis]XP_028164735.1 PX domain-containing protein kinase-like protein [Ostrinia furnacalis]